MKTWKVRNGAADVSDVSVCAHVNGLLMTFFGIVENTASNVFRPGSISRNVTWILQITNLLFGLAATNSVEAQSNSGFVSMFDGETLDGWSVTPASAKNAWSTQDGMIVGIGDKGRSYLIFNRGDIADLEMKLSYRFPGKGNSGVSIRARVDETGRRDFQSYHADFGHLGIGKQVLGAWDFHTPGRTEHRCFRGDRLVINADDTPDITPIQNALTTEDIRRGDWNEVHIIARDNNFKLYINGKLASEYTEHLPSAQRLHKGLIQLQLHDPGMIVHFKDLYLKVIE